MLALELAEEQVRNIIDSFTGQETTVELDLKGGELRFSAGNQTMAVPFQLAEYDRALVEAGGWVEYADAHY